MKVTRDVVFDLLPAYFAGEVSADTRALIEEFFVVDPEFKRRAERFHTRGDEAETDPLAWGIGSASAFQRTRTLVQRQQQARTFGVAYGLAAIFALSISLVRSGDLSLDRRGVVVAIVFGLVSLGSWVQFLRMRRRQAMRPIQG